MLPSIQGAGTKLGEARTAMVLQVVATLAAVSETMLEVTPHHTRESLGGDHEQEQ